MYMHGCLAAMLQLHLKPVPEPAAGIPGPSPVAA